MYTLDQSCWIFNIFYKELAKLDITKRGFYHTLNFSLKSKKMKWKKKKTI